MNNKTSTPKQHKFPYFNPSTQIVYSFYQQAREDFNVYRKLERNQSEEEQKVLDACKSRLDMVERALVSCNPLENTNFVWRTLHRVKEDFLLLMPDEELRSESLKIRTDLEKSSLPKSVINAWVKKLDDLIEKPGSPDSKASLSMRLLNASKRTLDDLINDLISANQSHNQQHTIERYVCRGALRELNDFTDENFWDIWVKKWMQFVYSVLLVFLTYVLWRMGTVSTLICKASGVEPAIVPVLLLGAMGGITSGILSSSQELFSKGSFWIPTIYHSLSRSLVGGITALVIFWLIIGNFLISISPRVIICCNDQVGISNPQPDRTTALISINTPDQSASRIVLLLLLFLGGFAGDKLLKSVCDKVLGNLYQKAEKTKQKNPETVEPNGDDPV
ncbi:hypothetical protein QA601_02910 [Chitinispirillales bacterium ANBcel5]|uniref:hypothetical protein n=1 Tax=Cellulosispirillum alkaliphilum TaxID=3039283 RepID=UPI002A4F8AB8|nr:hypothetical protein [Chitinispirillales bacterium ANBcel5]